MPKKTVLIVPATNIRGRALPHGDRFIYDTSDHIFETGESGDNGGPGTSHWIVPDGAAFVVATADKRNKRTGQRLSERQLVEWVVPCACDDVLGDIVLRNLKRAR